MSKTRVMLISIVLLFILPLAFSAEPVYQDAASCCANPILGSLACQDSSDRPTQYFTQWGCCGGDPYCETNYFHEGHICSDTTNTPALLGCSGQQQAGCCISVQEGCVTVQSDVQCQAPKIYRTGSCTGNGGLEECKPKCCLCKDSAGVCRFFSTQDMIEIQCTDACQKRGYDVQKWYIPPNNICQCEAEAPTTYRVYGVVESLGKPVPGAQVSLLGSTPVITGTDGSFEIFDVAPGAYTLKVSASTYDDSYKSINVATADFDAGTITLFQVALGNVQGTVKSNQKPVATFMLRVTPEDSTTYSNYMFFNGDYLLTLPFAIYDLQIIAPGYQDSSVQIVTLDAGNPTDTKNFVLQQKITGTIQVIADDQSDKALQGVSVTLETGESCSTDNSGTCQILDVVEGVHRYSVYKNAAYKAYADQTITVAARGVVTASVTLTIKTNLCNYTDTDFFEEGNCSKVNKPLYCVTGDTNNPSAQVIDYHRCYGHDSRIGYFCEGAPTTACTVDDDCIDPTANANYGKCITDDCGCPQGMSCQSNGYCISNTNPCMPDCTYAQDNICHIACEGVNGCKFNSVPTISQTIAGICDSKGLNSLQLYQPAVGQTPEQRVRCCNKDPFSYKDEADNCANNVDDDLDLLTDCDDFEDCLGKQCDDTDANYVCSVKDYVLGCNIKECPAGALVANDKDCACGGDVNVIYGGGSDKFCCKIDKTIYGSQDFSLSVCGDNNPCTSAGHQCCPGGCAPPPPSSIANNPDFTCGKAGTFCCLSTSTCFSQPEYACDYAKQCDDIIPEPNAVSVTGKVGCNSPCEPVPYCAPNSQVSSRTANPLGICKCSNEPVIEDTNSPINSQKSCCTTLSSTTECDENANCYTTDGDCPYSVVGGTLKGKITEKYTNAPIGFATIYIDGSIAGYSEGYGLNIGNYEISGVSLGQRHRVYAAKLSTHKQSIIESITITDASTPVQQPFELEPLQNICTANELLKVEKFDANIIPGQVKKAKLNWTGPFCSNKRSYAIWRLDNAVDQAQCDTTDGVFLGVFQPTLTGETTDMFLDIIDDPDTAVDESISPYSQTYTYRIKVMYDGGRESGGECKTISIGDKECEGQYDPSRQKFVSFCLDDYKHTKCDEKNKKTAIRNCDPNNFCSSSNTDPFTNQCRKCSGPDTDGNVVCKLADQCDIFMQNAYPFGLFYDHDKCLGQRNINYCYYDAYSVNPYYNAISPTPIDRCLSCDNVKEGGCYTYKSEAACMADNCDVGQGKCNWMDTSYGELGAGICYLEGYDKTDKCSLCTGEPDRDIFFNAECSQSICSNLGNCFSYNFGERCKSCDLVKCKDYFTEETCVGVDQKPMVITGDEYNTSEDACNIGKCRWSDNKCYKDGDGQTQDDCETQLANTILFPYKNNCKSDNDEPNTLLIDPYNYPKPFEFRKFGGGVPEKLTFITEDSLTHPGDTFLGPSLFYYCITQELDDTCIFGGMVYDVGDKIELRYFEEIAGPYLAERGQFQAEPGNYYLKYYSIDRSFNRERTKSILFYADVRKPKLTLTSQLELGDPPSADPLSVVSKLTFGLTADEDVYCRDSLVNQRTPIPQIKLYEANKIPGEAPTPYMYEGLSDGIYYYSLECRDELGNWADYCVDDNVRRPECIFEIDAYKGIKIVSPTVIPPSTINTAPVFSIEVSDESAGCRLIDSDNPSWSRPFIYESYDTGKKAHIHTCGKPNTNTCTDVLDTYNFPNGRYYPNFEVTCEPSQSHPRPFPQKQFIFTHDKTPPNSTIILTTIPQRAGIRTPLRPVEERVNSSGWSKRYNSKVVVRLDCEDPLLGDDSTVYGVTRRTEGRKGCVAVPQFVGNQLIVSCEPIAGFWDTPQQVEGSDGEKVICYQCADDGDNTEQKKCGTIIVDTEVPSFKVAVFDKDNNPVTTLIRDTPEIKYKVRVTSSEFLQQAISLTFMINNAPYFGSFKLENISALETNRIFVGEIIIPPSTGVSEDMFGGLGAQDSVEFAVLNGIDLAGNSGHNITEGKEIVIDTTIPPPPILLDYPATMYLKYSPTDTFYQAGIEGEEVPGRQVVIDSSTGGKVEQDIHGKVLGFTPLTLNKIDPCGTQYNPPVRSGMGGRGLTNVLGTQDRCTDSDDGKNYSLKGRAKGKDDTGNDVKLEDNCKLDNGQPTLTLIEYYCENDVVKSIEHGCDSDCTDGECVNEPSPVIPTTVTTASNNLPSRGLASCSDSAKITEVQTTMSTLVNSSSDDPELLFTAKVYSAPSDKTKLRLKDLPQISTTDLRGKYIRFVSESLADPDKKFYQLSEIVPGSDTMAGGATLTETFSLDRPLKRSVTDYQSDTIIKVYNKSVPKAWFDVNLNLVEGSNWFYAYSIDEAGNKGEKTEIKKVIYDLDKPSLEYASPANGSVLSVEGRMTVAATVRDPNSGLKINTLVFTLDNDSYNCLDDELECVGSAASVSKTLSLLLDAENIGAGIHNVSLFIEDKSGNKENFNWSFEVKDNVPGKVRLSTEYGNCVSNGLCYVNTLTPSFTFDYNAEVDITEVRMYSGGGINTHVVKLTPDSKSFNITPEQPLAQEGHHQLEIITNTGEMLANYINFVVDKTPPEISLDNIGTVNRKEITLSGTYTEDNVDYIEFSGGLKKPSRLTSYELPTDIIQGTVNIFRKENLELDVGAESIDKTIDVTIYDKARNFNTVSITLHYDKVLPYFVSVDVEKTNPDTSKKMIAVNSSLFKTNDVNVKLVGKMDKNLTYLELASNKRRWTSNDNLKFNYTSWEFEAVLGLDNRGSTEPEDMVLIARDMSGNIEVYFLTVDLDVRAPVPRIRWI